MASEIHLWLETINKYIDVLQKYKNLTIYCQRKKIKNVQPALQFYTKLRTHIIFFHRTNPLYKSVIFILRGKIGLVGYKFAGLGSLEPSQPGDLFLISHLFWWTRTVQVWILRILRPRWKLSAGGSVMDWSTNYQDCW